jgi:hypothetical protein
MAAFVDPEENWDTPNPLGNDSTRVVADVPTPEVRKGGKGETRVCGFFKKQQQTFEGGKEHSTKTRMID